MGGGGGPGGVRGLEGDVGALWEGCGGGGGGMRLATYDLRFSRTVYCKQLGRVISFLILREECLGPFC